MSEARTPPAGFGIKTGQVAETLQVRQTGRADGLNVFKHRRSGQGRAQRLPGRVDRGWPIGTREQRGRLDQQLEPGRQLFDLALHVVQMMLSAISRELELVERVSVQRAGLAAMSVINA